MIRRLTSSAILTKWITSCSQDIAGLNQSQRLALYQLGATATGHPEAGSIIYGARRLVNDTSK